MLAATWGVSADQLDTLRAALDSADRRPETTAVRLTPAPVLSPRCLLLLGSGDGSFQPVGTSPTSRVWPYDAVFGVTLQGDDIARARRALAGEPGLLAIEYVGDVSRLVTAAGTLRASNVTVHELTRQADRDRRRLRTALEDALTTGRATFTPEPSTGVPADMAVALRDRVLTRAVDAAWEWSGQPGNTDLEVTVAFERTVRETVRARTDVGVAVGPATSHQ
jgi:hypothetical protein